MIEAFSPGLMDAMQTAFPEDVDQLSRWDLPDLEKARVILKLVIKMAEQDVLLEPKREAMAFLFERLHKLADGDGDPFGLGETSGSTPIRHTRKTIAALHKDLKAAGVRANEAKRLLASLTGASESQIHDATRGKNG